MHEGMETLLGDHFIRRLVRNKFEKYLSLLYLQVEDNTPSSRSCLIFLNVQKNRRIITDVGIVHKVIHYTIIIHTM